MTVSSCEHAAIITKGGVSWYMRVRSGEHGHLAAVTPVDGIASQNLALTVLYVPESGVDCLICARIWC